MFKVEKKIHIIWFGGNPLPQGFIQNYLSIKTYASNYKVYFWDESNLNVYENAYTTICYKNGWFAHLSDYFRIKVVWEHGGIYLDVDLILIDYLDDSIIEYPLFSFEDITFNGRKKRMFGSGWGFSSHKNSSLLSKILISYENFDTRAIDYDLNIPTWTDLIYQTPTIENFIDDKKNNEVKNWNFVPHSLLENYIITLNFASWINKKEIDRQNYINRFRNLFGDSRFARFCISLTSYIYCYGIRKGIKFLFNRTLSMLKLKLIYSKNRNPK